MRLTFFCFTYAQLAELADALDLGSSGRPWGFESLVAHQQKYPVALLPGISVATRGREHTWARIRAYDTM